MKKISYDELLDEILSQKESFGYPAEAPCYAERLSEFNAVFARKFKIELPQKIEDFLKKTNGLEWNGTTLLGVDDEKDFSVGGLLTFNASAKERPPRMLLLGWSDISQFVYDPQANKHRILDDSTGEILESFDSFDELLYRVLSELLSSEET